jgi:hypothetical protein
MAIDFPDSPTSNQIYTSGGRSWIWNGSSWDINILYKFGYFLVL